MKEMNLHFQNQVNSIDIKNLSLEMVDAVTDNFKNNFGVVLNQFKDNYNQMAQ